MKYVRTPMKVLRKVFASDQELEHWVLNQAAVIREKNRGRPLMASHRKVLAFIESFIADKGYSPTYQEILDGCGMRSMGHLTRLMNDLRRAGRIDWTYNRKRSVQLVNGCSYVATQAFPMRASNE